jgi:2-amino-4-hydroxy-6-hydroxymethyldihydropteridine diphosphokinase
MACVYIGIGSNLGDREFHCSKAIELLKDAGIKVEKKSKPVETKPWGVEDQPAFINMAVSAETFLEPVELLSALKAIEKTMGRDMDAERWGPRVIDLDIIMYDDLVLDSPELTIPHKHMHERDFVLGPLAEIAPELMHPVFHKSVSELFEALK